MHYQAVAVTCTSIPFQDMREGKAFKYNIGQRMPWSQSYTHLWQYSSTARCRWREGSDLIRTCFRGLLAHHDSLAIRTVYAHKVLFPEVLARKRAKSAVPDPEAVPSMEATR